jgi:hypothetical protein
MELKKREVKEEEEEDHISFGQIDKELPCIAQELGQCQETSGDRKAEANSRKSYTKKNKRL